MERKYTPGPWKVNEYGNIEQNNGAYHLVATCSGISSNLKERESNAQLIACAPEMLEALEWILQISETVDLKQPVDVEQTINGIKQMARQQINKAKGGKQ